MPEKREWKSKNVKAIHCYEQLEEIEKATGDEKIKLVKVYGEKAPLSFILSLNFNHNVKLELPEGMPPIEPKEMDTITHPDMMGTLASSIHRLSNCLVGSPLKQFKKEEIFIQVILACPLKDAEILCSAKDRALEELYPSITKELVKSVYPAYVS